MSISIDRPTPERLLESYADHYNALRGLAHQLWDQLEELLKRLEQLHSFDPDLAFRIAVEAVRREIVLGQQISMQDPTPPDGQDYMEFMAQSIREMENSMALTESYIEWMREQYELVIGALAR
jgi:hypothetical protein